MTQREQKESILVCVLPDLEGITLRHYVLNVASFAVRVGVDVHFLTSTQTQPDLSSALDGIPGREFRAIKTVFHPIAATWPSAAVSEAVRLYSCILAVLPSGSVGDDNGSGARIRKDLLEQASAPILVLSPRVDLGKISVDSMLIPLSGEIRVSSALKFGLQLASRIHIPVDLVHVTQEQVQTKSALETIGDQPHHEYRDLLEHVLAEASPFSSPEERAQVRTLRHVRGAPATEIMKRIEETPSCALVAEWHGSLIQGKAETLKDLLYGSAIPIFIVKTESEQKSVLKIGPEDRVA